MYNENTGNYITPIGRASFPRLDEPKQINNQGEPKYQLTIIFDKEAQQSDDFKDLEAAVEKAISDKWGKNKPRRVKEPFLTVEDFKKNVPSGYDDDCVFIRLASSIPVGCIVATGKNKSRRLESKSEIKKEIYAGCDIRAAVNVYAWDHPTGGPGVSFGLANVMKTGDNEPFGASNSDAADDFGVPVTEGSAQEDFMG